MLKAHNFRSWSLHILLHWIVCHWQFLVLSHSPLEGASVKPRQGQYAQIDPKKPTKKTASNAVNLCNYMTEWHGQPCSDVLVSCTCERGGGRGQTTDWRQTEGGRRKESENKSNSGRQEQREKRVMDKGREREPLCMRVGVSICARALCGDEDLQSGVSLFPPLLCAFRSGPRRAASHIPLFQMSQRRQRATYSVRRPPATLRNSEETGSESCRLDPWSVPTSQSRDRLLVSMSMFRLRPFLSLKVPASFHKPLFCWRY